MVLAGNTALIARWGPKAGNSGYHSNYAFGIAIVKAFMVAANFMHLKFEKHIIWFMMLMSLTLLGVFFFGVAPDIMQTEGDQWIDCISDNSCVEQRL
ncbi:MAG: hypothetical protein CM1200mP30_11580 [Pseudomonadota bacterium]|nr:MAG: hypothetical protein CM1200mP30_11580 [Pseudomonadota bacterium]